MLLAASVYTRLAAESEDIIGWEPPIVHKMVANTAFEHFRSK